MVNTPKMQGVIHHRENKVKSKDLDDLSVLGFYVNQYFM